MAPPKIFFEGLETPLVCGCCGKVIDLEKESPVINFEPGFRNYPVAPDEPAEIYLECLECYLPIDVPERLETLIDDQLELIDGTIDLDERQAFWEALRLWIGEENKGV